MRILALTVVLLALGCHSHDELENRQNYIFEIIRQRPLSPEKCVSYSDSKMTCTLNKTKNCACVFAPDEVDEENAIYQAAVERRAKQLAEEEAGVSRSIPAQKSSDDS
jgi:hypothetical protein